MDEILHPALKKHLADRGVNQNECIPAVMKWFRLTTEGSTCVWPCLATM